MSLWDDERAQPIQIGFILVFAVLIVSFAVYQSVFVPQQNAEIEFQHYQQVGQDMTDLRNDLRTAVGSESTRSASVALGTTYPARVFALNPTPPGGTLSTTDAGTVEVNGISKNATQLCADASTRNTVESRSLSYRPSYNEYGPAKNVSYENTFVVRSFRDGERYGTQNLVEEASGSGDNRINLRLLTSEFSESGTGTTSVDLDPSRTYEESFSPTGSFSIVVPSQFAPETWENEILDDASGVVNRVMDADAGGVERVEIFLDTTVDYTVSCAAVGLNEQPAYQPPEPVSDDVDNPPTASIDYLEDTSDDPQQGASVAEYTVGWNVSDDTGLQDIEIELINRNGRVVDSASPTVSGTTNTGEATLGSGGFEERYVIKVTVTDTDGQADTESVTDFADGE